MWVDFTAGERRHPRRPSSRTSKGGRSSATTRVGVNDICRDNLLINDGYNNILIEYRYNNLSINDHCDHLLIYDCYVNLR